MELIKPQLELQSGTATGNPLWHCFLMQPLMQ